MGSVVWKSKFQDISTAFPPNWIFRIKQQKVELAMLKLLAFCTLVAMVLADGKCPNENWKYNTTLCQKLQVDDELEQVRTWDYCCELEYPGLSETFIDTWYKLAEECSAKSDDHVTVGMTNGVFYGVDSVL